MHFSYQHKFHDLTIVKMGCFSKILESLPIALSLVTHISFFFSLKTYLCLIDHDDSNDIINMSPLPIK